MSSCKKHAAVSLHRLCRYTHIQTHTDIHARKHTHHTYNPSFTKTSTVQKEKAANPTHCSLLSHCSKEIPRGRLHVHPLPLAEAAEATHCTAAAAPLEGTDHVDHFLVLVISEDHRETPHPSMKEATQSAGVWAASVIGYHIAQTVSLTVQMNTPSSAHQNGLSAVLFTIVNFFR